MKKLPAGLTDNSMEVFLHQGKLLALQNGHTVEYFDLHNVMREPFQAELIRDKAALNCLKTQFNLYEADEMEYKFVACRYGALNAHPDMEGLQLTPDAPGCGNIATCKGFNVVCKVPPGPNGVLSHSEYMVAQLVAQGKIDKEIADMLNIKVPTVRTHLSRIRDKLCVNNRIEISIWCHNQGI